jgi:ribosomal protein S18 acetylase RimI-like enzyme
MENTVEVRKIPEDGFDAAIEVYTEAFTDDPLHVYLFPDAEERERITNLFYEMMVNEFVYGLNLQFRGVYENNAIAAALIYARPDATEWNEDMMNIVMEMRSKAKNEKVNFVSEYTMKANNFKPREKHIYLNELAVGKKHRGKGYARMLIADAEKDAKNFPETKVMGLDTSNKANVDIYRHLGFNIYKEFPFRGLKGYVMRKSIN